MREIRLVPPNPRVRVDLVFSLIPAPNGQNSNLPRCRGEAGGLGELADFYCEESSAWFWTLGEVKGESIFVCLAPLWARIVVKIKITCIVGNGLLTHEAEETFCDAWSCEHGGVGAEEGGVGGAFVVESVMRRAWSSVRRWR